MEGGSIDVVSSLNFLSVIEEIQPARSISASLLQCGFPIPEQNWLLLPVPFPLPFLTPLHDFFESMDQFRDPGFLRFHLAVKTLIFFPTSSTKTDSSLIL
jgi:hypothetical protein